MFWQLHHQYKDETTFCYAQKEVTSDTSYEDVRAWVREVRNVYPLPTDPSGVRWLMCNENSPSFCKSGPPCTIEDWRNELAVAKGDET